MAPILVATALASASCADDPWYRAENRFLTMQIFRADSEEDSCLEVKIQKVDPSRPGLNVPDWYEPLGAVVVDAPGSGDVAAYAFEHDVGSARCGLQVPPGFSGPTYEVPRVLSSGSGQIRLTGGNEFAFCRVRLDATIDGRSFEGSVDVYNRFQCPQPRGDTFKVGKLGASAPTRGDDYLSLRSWDGKRGICYALDFSLRASGGEAESLTMPEGWNLLAAEIYLFGTRASCENPDLQDEDEEMTRINGNLDDASGWLRFERSQPWAVPGDDTPTPCEISVDVRVNFPTSAPGVPHKLRFVDNGVTVAKACDG